MVVRVKRRKTREPVVKVHFYLHGEDGKWPILRFLGEGYMSFHNAIVLADCSRLGAKIALPNGRWTRAELVADVKVSPEGKEYGRGLRLDMSSMHERARRRAGSSLDIFDLPLCEDCENPEFDWIYDFPAAKRKSKRWNVLW
jgi:hypothetical protein